MSQNSSTKCLDKVGDEDTRTAIMRTAGDASLSSTKSGGEGQGRGGLSNRHKKPLSPALSPLRREREKIPQWCRGLA